MKIEIRKPQVKLQNGAGMSLTLNCVGAGIESIKIPDKLGAPREMTKLAAGGYYEDYHGKTIGRTSGRIANAAFEIDGKRALLEKNNFGADNLHGGASGLHTKNFDCEIKEGDDFTEVIFSCFSPDGEGGYFGNVHINITYRVYENQNKFTIFFRGDPEEKLLLNLTNHAYFNLSGDLRQPVSEQEMYVNASRVGVLNERLICEDVAPVSREFDFRTPKTMGRDLHAESVQRYTKGYDHPFFLDGGEVACSLKSSLSGIKLEVKTSYPCVVIFGDNFENYFATCFECQFHPDGIHAQSDDCGVCSPEKPYSEYTEFNFITEKLC